MKLYEILYDIFGLFFPTQIMSDFEFVFIIVSFVLTLGFVFWLFYQLMRFINYLIRSGK